MNEIRAMKSAVTTVQRAEDGKLHIVLPDGFELPEGELRLLSDGERLTVEPLKSKLTFEEALALMVPLTDEEWPDIDNSDLPPLRDIEL